MPLITSTAITKVPHLDPSTRKVLVAPALPLPYSRMSIPKKDLLTQMAVGTEPIRYADRISKTSFIERVELKLDNKYNEKMTFFHSYSAPYFALFSVLRQIQLPFVVRTDMEILFFTASF